MIRNLIFDLGGVIVLLDKQQAFDRFRAIGLDVDRYLGLFGQRGFCYDFEAGLIDKAEFRRQLAEATGRNEVTDEQAAHCWLGYLASTPTHRLEQLLELRKRFHLCLLSNTNPYVMEFVRSEAFSALGKPISHYFDSQFISYEMKSCKPHAEIFLAALKADNMQPHETLFIDDSKANIEAAAALGLHTLHIDTNEEWGEKLSHLLAL